MEVPKCTFHMHSEDILASIICLGVWTWFKVEVGLQFRFWFGSGAGEGTSMEVFTEASKNTFYIIFSDGLRNKGSNSN